MLSRALEQAGCTVFGAENDDDCLNVLGREPIDQVLLDLKLKGEDGLTILRRIPEHRPEVVAIILTAYATVPTVVEAMQLGAAAFLCNPFDVEEVVFKVARALERRAMQQEITRLTVLQRSAPAFNTLIGADVKWLHLVAQARRVALIDHDVMLVGEQATGCTSLARAMHVASPRAGARLIKVDLGVNQGTAQAVALFGGSGVWAEAGSGAQSHVSAARACKSGTGRASPDPAGAGACAWQQEPRC